MRTRIWCNDRELAVKSVSQTILEVFVKGVEPYGQHPSGGRSALI